MNLPDPRKRISIVSASIFAAILLLVTGLAVWFGFFPSSQQKLLDRGIALADAEPEQSERWFRRVISAGSQQDANVKLTFAWLDANHGAWTQAEQAFQNVDPALCRGDLLLLFARKAIKAKHFPVAIQALEPLRNRETPETHEALALLWSAYAAHGTQDDALAVGRELLKRQPLNHPQRLELIRGLKGAYKEVECLDEVRTALQGELPPPIREELENLLLEQLIVLGDVPAAWKQLAELEQRDGPSIPLQSKAVDLYRAEGRLDEALAAISELFPKIEHLPVAYLTRGVVLLDLGRFAEAAKDLDRVVAADPMNEGARFKLSVAYQRLGQEKLASEHREIWAGIRQKRMRITELLLLQRTSVLSKNDCTELSRLHREIGDFDRSRYWQQRAAALK